MRIEYDCEQCGIHVVKTRSPATMKVAPRFCSQQCNGASRKGTGAGPTPNCEVKCESCGVVSEVYRSPSAPLPRFCSVQCTGVSQMGEGNPAYTGGSHIGANGYVHLLRPNHLDADSRGYVYEHRFVMEHHIGRRLTSDEVVHHINEVKTDNRIGNLQLLASQSDHLALHLQIRRSA